MTGFAMRSIAVLAAVAAALAAQAAAQTPAQRATAFTEVLACRKLTDDAARLACFDKASAGMEAAEKAGDIVVVDREQARATRRQAFGFSLPSLTIFDRGEKPEALDQLAATAKRAWRGGDNKWRVELEDGAVWAQTDNENVGRPPKAGSRVEIRKASMGGYFMNLDGQRAVRARRER
jgi:hypothetical protein